MISSLDRAPRGRDYLVMLRDSWVILACVAAISAVLGWYTWNYVNPLYTSTAKFLAIVPGGATPIDAFYGDVTGKAKIPTHLMLAKDRRVTEPTVQQLQLPISPDDLADNIKIQPSASALFDVTVEGGDAAQTRLVAAAVAHNLVAVSQQMATVDKGGTELIQIDQPTEAKKVGSLKRSLGLSMGISLAMAVILIIARALIADRVVAPGQVGHIVRTEIKGRRR